MLFEQLHDGGFVVYNQNLAHLLDLRIVNLETRAIKDESGGPNSSLELENPRAWHLLMQACAQITDVLGSLPWAASVGCARPVIDIFRLHFVMVCKKHARRPGMLR